MHLVAIAAAAGITVEWDDFAALSNVVPLITRIYPNGIADVNHFHAAGGMGFLIGTLLDTAGLDRHISPAPRDPAYSGLAEDPEARGPASASAYAALMRIQASS